MALDETFKSIKVHLKDRMTSPLFGAFFVSWVFCNYRALWVLFSDLSIDDKFERIDKLYPAHWTLERFLEVDNWSNFAQLIIVPLFMAYGFLFFYPWLSRPIFRWWRLQQKILQEMLQKIEDRIPVDEKELKEIKKAYEDRMDELNNLVIKRENDIQRIKSHLNEEQAQNSELRRLVEQYKANTEGATNPKKSVEIQNLESNIQSTILSNTLVLQYNPDDDNAHKKMSFLREGRILEGRNQNEYSWRIKNGKLELLNQKGQVHSRFNYTPEKQIFVSTDDEDTKSIRGQIMTIWIDPFQL